MSKSIALSIVSIAMMLTAGAAAAEPTVYGHSSQAREAPRDPTAVEAVRSMALDPSVLPEGIAVTAVAEASTVAAAWTAYRRDNGADPTLDALVEKGYLRAKPKLPPRVIDLRLVSDIDYATPGEQTAVIMRTSEEICRYVQALATGDRPNATLLDEHLPAQPYGCFLAAGEPIIVYKR